MATDPTFDDRYSLIIQSRRRQYVRPVSDLPLSSGGCFLTVLCPRTDEDPPAFLVSFDFPSLESMIGMLTTPGYGLVDTGAQHGVIGSKEYAALCDFWQSED